MWSHDELENLAAGYVLLALEQEERAAFESHVSTCTLCAQSVAELRGVAGALAFLAEDVEPPPRLRDRILAAARAEKAARESMATSPRRSPRAWWSMFARPATAFVVVVGLLLVAIVALSFWVSRIQDRLDISEVRIARGYQAISIMAQAEQWWRFEGTDEALEAKGAMAYSSEQEAACIVAMNLSPNEGSRYHVWTVKDGVNTSVGRMWPLGEDLWIIIPGNVADLDAVTITLEEARSPSEPSGRVVARIPVNGS